VLQCIHRISLEKEGLIAQDSNCQKELNALLAAPQVLLQKPVLEWILEESTPAVAEGCAAASANETCVDDAEEPADFSEPELTIVRKTAHPKGLERAQHSFLVWVLASKAALNRRL
jgi:hypothetical protein